MLQITLGLWHWGLSKRAIGLGQGNLTLYQLTQEQKAAQLWWEIFHIIKCSWKWSKRDLLKNFVSSYLHKIGPNDYICLFLDFILVHIKIKIFLSNTTFTLIITVILDWNVIWTAIFQWGWEKANSYRRSFGHRVVTVHTSPHCQWAFHHLRLVARRFFKEEPWGWDKAMYHCLNRLRGKKFLQYNGWFFTLWNIFWKRSKRDLLR